MKLCCFALNSHRELPDDFERRYRSVWVDVPWRELGDARRCGDYYNWHRQNAHGCQPNASLSRQATSASSAVRAAAYRSSMAATRAAASATLPDSLKSSSSAQRRDRERRL
jgi:hypothetical protein